MGGAKHGVPPRTAVSGGDVVSATSRPRCSRGCRAAMPAACLSRPADGEDEGHCPRCDEKLYFRKPESIQRTWAFLIAAAVCYVPANILPVLTTITAEGRESDTILQGVVLLWSPTGWPLSLIVLIRQRHDPEREDRGARLPARNRAARLDREQCAARPALPRRQALRTLVDGRRVRRHLHGGARAAPAAHVGGAGGRAGLLRGGRGADDARC